MTGSLVCLLAAGRGTRVRAFGGRLHKALLPLGDAPVLTHVIRSFPDDTRFVVALGYLGGQVRDYLALAHPSLRVQFVDVDPYEGPGSGPGRSLWECKPFLDAPFVLTACDAICTKPMPAPLTNWMGAQAVLDPEHWCTLDLGPDGQVRSLHYKDPAGPMCAFVGVAGIADHERFFAGLGADLASTGEIQVNRGFEALVAAGVETVELGWLDAGTDETYAATRRTLGIERDLTFTGKATDATFRVDDAIVKMFFDDERAGRQAARLRAASGVAPALRGAAPQGIAYEFVAGDLYDERVDAASVTHFLDWVAGNYWTDLDADPARFAAACQAFYVDKTQQRLAAYVELARWDAEPAALVINGRETRPVADALAEFAASAGRPSTFHGDLHGRNILRTGGGYCLIDWREDFGGSTDVGDRYYDLAKFLHTLELSVDVMERNEFSVRAVGSGFEIGQPDEPVLRDCRRALWSWAAASYNAQRIAVVDAIVFVNMAPLYERPLADYLYLLGRALLDAAQDDARRPDRIFDEVVHGV